ncbi:MAG: hypothetical protein O3A63_16335 [Proteobacteria bacterium]|nr:hypothetical protein [Pseudomonadota bacterium]
MKYFTRFLLLTIAFALTTSGLLFWYLRDFSFHGLMFFDNGYLPHPLHVLVLGLAMIPPALWEIFLLENQVSHDH